MTMSSSDGDPRPTRRSFVDWFLGTTMAAVGGAILYPVLRYVIPPAVAESAASRVLAGSLSALPPNSGKIFRFGSKPGIVLRTPTGEVRAFSAICTHLNCTVQYRPDLQQIWCACHNGHYNLNGVNVSGPPPRPLESYSVALKGDEIWVSREA